MSRNLPPRVEQVAIQYFKSYESLMTPNRPHREESLRRLQVAFVVNNLSEEVVSIFSEGRPDRPYVRLGAYPSSVTEVDSQ